MKIDLEHLDLIGLIGEKYTAMRQRCDQLWNDQGKVRVSTSEWQLLTRIYGRELSISDVARAADITRQATHKSLMSLQDKGLLEMVAMPHNKRDKYVVLTPFGQQCCDERAALKRELEQQVAGVIGAENVTHMKTLLKTEWL